MSKISLDDSACRFWIINKGICVYGRAIHEIK